MSSSTRKKAIQLWQTDIPEGDNELLAKTLFSFENPPGTKYVSGSQDSIGIVMPGVNKLEYESGQYWPSKITTVHARELADAASDCWHAIQCKDPISFGQAFRRSFEAQIAMFPHMVNDSILEQIEDYRPMALGWKLSGAGGGGYLVLVSEQPVPNAIQIRIRR